MFDVSFLRMLYICSKSFVKVWKEPRKTSKVRRRSTFIFKWSRKFCYVFLFFLYIFIFHIHVVLLALVLLQIIAYLFKNSRFKSYNCWESLQKLIFKLASFPIINVIYMKQKLLSNVPYFFALFNLHVCFFSFDYNVSKLIQQ